MATADVQPSLAQALAADEEGEELPDESTLLLDIFVAFRHVHVSHAVLVLFVCLSSVVLSMSRGDIVNRTNLLLNEVKFLKNEATR